MKKRKAEVESTIARAYRMFASRKQLNVGIKALLSRVALKTSS